MRKTYQLQPELFLLAGCDVYHEARVGPVTIAEMFELLKRTPEDAYRDRDGRHADLMMDAVVEFNQSILDDEDPACPAAWRWLGFALSGRLDAVHLWVTRKDHDEESGVCTIGVDQDAIDSQARACALAAFTALQPLVQTEGVE